MLLKIDFSLLEGADTLERNMIDSMNTIVDGWNESKKRIIRKSRKLQ